MKTTKPPLELSVGDGMCFHKGNRVAIVKRHNDDEGTEETVAEVWPTEGDVDINDGKKLVVSFNLHDKLVAAVKHVVASTDDPDNKKDKDLVEAINWQMLRDVLEEAEKGAQ